MKRTVITTILCLTAAGASAFAGPFTNGSFETGVDPGPNFGIITAGTNGITGWTVGGAGVDYIGGYWPAFDGVRSLDMNARDAGSVSQAFDTLIGQAYLVTFYMSKNPGTASATMDVSAAGTTSSYSFNAANSSSNMLWAQKTFTFTANSTSTTLSFNSTTSGSFGPALDAITVDVAGVPEPGTAGLLLCGLAGVVFGIRKRR